MNRLADADIYEDGNKRTAWTVAETYLNEAGKEAVPSDDVAERVLLNRGRFNEAELATWLETGDIPDAKFRDSDKIKLLSNPSGRPLDEPSVPCRLWGSPNSRAPPGSSLGYKRLYLTM